MTDRGQAPLDVLPSAMQLEQPTSLVRSLSALIEHLVAGYSVVVVGETGPHSEQGCPRVWGRAFEPWGNDSPWAGALGRAADCYAA